MNENYPLYNVRRINSLRELVEFRFDESGEAPAFIYENDGIKQVITYRQLKDQTECFGTALLKCGYRDCKIALLGENSYEWLLAFFAVTGCNNVVVPLDKELSAEAMGNLMQDSGCTLLIASDLYADIAEELKNRTKVSCISMKEISAMIEDGKKLLAEGDSSYTGRKIDEESTAAIVYTSGTTGRSKGVMLSHKNLALDTYAACCNFCCDGNTLLLLPLHHTFGSVAGVFATLLYGNTVYINTSLRNLLSDFQKARPKNLFLVPLFVEMLYKNVCKALGNDKVKITAAFGGKLEYIISGGAALNPSYIQAFRDIGIELLNGYGITECSPVVSVNRNHYHRDGSVGQVLNECDVRIDSPNSDGEGEICVKGSIVMKGYYHMNEETAEGLKDGWFYTGDLGYVDEDGFLFITGRKKNLIILENGENVSPEELETLIQNIPNTAEVVVYESEKRIVAEIYPNIQENAGIELADWKAYFEKEIAVLNQTLPRFKQITKVIIRSEEFEKTTTKKIKRNVIGEK